MKEKNHITIFIPVRIDSEDLRTNLDTVFDYLYEYVGVKVLLLEADSKPQYRSQKEYPNIVCYFIEDNNPIFHRTCYINSMLRNIHSPFAGVWDSNVIVLVEQIIEAVRHCIDNVTLCYPFVGRFHVGEGFVANMEKYLSNGVESEYFYGCSPEDKELCVWIANLGLNVNRVPGCLFYLHHLRDMNSNFANCESELCARREYLKICRMDRTELEECISIWTWYNKNITSYAID